MWPALVPGIRCPTPMSICPATVRRRSGAVPRAEAKPGPVAPTAKTCERSRGTIPSAIDCRDRRRAIGARARKHSSAIRRKPSTIGRTIGRGPRGAAKPGRRPPTQRGTTVLHRLRWQTRDRTASSKGAKRLPLAQLARSTRRRGPRTSTKALAPLTRRATAWPATIRIRPAPATSANRARST